LLRRKRLRWYRHVQRKADDWMKRCINRCMNFEIEGQWASAQGRPKRTWGEVAECDLRTLGLQKDDACDGEDAFVLPIWMERTVGILHVWNCHGAAHLV